MVGLPSQALYTSADMLFSTLWSSQERRLAADQLRQLASLSLAFLVISDTWLFHVRLFAIVRPSNFVLVTNSTSFPSVMTGSKTLCSLAKEILSSLHLLAFSLTLFSQDHSITL